VKFVLTAPWWVSASLAGTSPASTEAAFGPEARVSPTTVLPDVIEPVEGEEEASDDGATSVSTSSPTVPAPKMPPQPIVRVAVGLAPEAPGSAEEEALVRTLHASLIESTTPRAQVRTFAAGSADGRALCRRGDDELIIAVGYLPDRQKPVLLPYDCLLDQPLGARAARAATDPQLLSVLWTEHDDALARGAQERRQRSLSRPARTALVATSATLLIAGAVGAIVASTLRKEQVVLKVEPR